MEQTFAKLEATASSGVAPYGAAAWTKEEISTTLARLSFPASAPLSCLAVELLPNGEPVADPLGTDLGTQRILRTSPLSPVPDVCVC
jgi:hypothetical protein